MDETFGSCDDAWDEGEEDGEGERDVEVESSVLLENSDFNA